MKRIEIPWVANKANKVSSCEVSTSKIINRVENYCKYVLEGFENCYSRLAEKSCKYTPPSIQ